MTRTQPKNQSSHIKSVGHENGTLEVEFANGGVYQYHNTDQAHLENLINADSPGKYLNSEIKGKHNYIKVN